MPVLNHKHILINAVVRNPPKEGDEELVADWLRRLIAAVGMKIVIEPRVHYCKADENEGITASVNIETSHASLHVWDKLPQPLFRFDLYSCAEFDPEVVFGFVKEFDPWKIEHLLIDRNDFMILEDNGCEFYGVSP